MALGDTFLHDTPCLGWPAEHIDGELLFDTDAEAIALAERLAYDTEFSAVHAKRTHASTAPTPPPRT